MRTSHSRINFYLLAAIVLVFPFSLKICNALIIIIGCHWLWWLSQERESFRFNKPVLILLLSPFILSAISLIYTNDIKAGLFVLDKKFSLFVFPLVLGTIPQMTENRRNRLLKITCLSITLAGLLCLLVALYRYVQDIPGGFFWSDFTAPISLQHPTYFSIILNFLIFYLGSWLFEHWKDTTTHLRISALLLIILFYVFLILLSSKIQLVLSLAILIYFVALLSRFISAKTLIPVVIAVLVGCGWLLRNTYTAERFSSIMNLEYKIDGPVETFNELTIRIAIIQSGWDVIKDNFWFGVGNGDIAAELDKAYRKFDYKFGYLDQQNPHNEYLSQFLGIGFIGLLVFLLTLIIPLRLAAVNGDKLYIAFLVLFAISFTVESFLERQKGIVFFGLFNSVLMFTMPNNMSKKSTSKK